MNKHQTHNKVSHPLNLWDETKNPVTGESSLMYHTPRVVWQGCIPGECIVVDTDNPREKMCIHCKKIHNFIIGYHKLVDGKIIPA